jgi:hypothetical protein
VERNKEAILVICTQKTSTAHTPIGNVQLEELVTSSSIIAPGARLLKEIETDTHSKELTTLSSSSSASNGLQPEHQTVGILKEEDKHLKEQLKGDNDVHEELITLFQNRPRVTKTQLMRLPSVTEKQWTVQWIPCLKS